MAENAAMRMLTEKQNRNCVACKDANKNILRASLTIIFVGCTMTAEHGIYAAGITKGRNQINCKPISNAFHGVGHLPVRQAGQEASGIPPPREL